MENGDQVKREIVEDEAAEVEDMEPDGAVKQEP
jgi:hypothetical protein